MSVIIKNQSGLLKVYGGVEIANGGQYTIQDVERYLFSSDENLLADISSSDAVINDGTNDLGISDGIDHLKNYFNKSPFDNDTGGLSVSPKWAVDGWIEQMFELELETSKLNSIHEKDIDNVDLNFASLKFFKDVANVETEWTPVDQADLDANCIRTDLAWMPTHDYMIKSGYVSQIGTPSQDVYVWAVGADLDAIYGGPQIVFLEGGLNLAFTESLMLMGLDGVAASRMNYSHETLGDGKGTNRIRFIFRHPVGFKHRIQCVFDIFKG